jgi:hypothetical protein
MEKYKTPLKQALGNTYKKAVPAHIRTFAETLAGNKDPITEDNFTPEELEQVRSAVRQSKTTPRPKHYVQNEGKKGFKEVEEPKNTVHYKDYPTKKDLDLRASSAARNTLGRFRYDQTPDGKTVAKDTYDFEDDLVNLGERSSAEYKAMSTPKKIGALIKDTVAGSGLKTLPSRVGSAFIGKDGRPVKVDLGAGLKKGGKVSAPKACRGDGCAQRGKTKGRFV